MQDGFSADGLAAKPATDLCAALVQAARGGAVIFRDDRESFAAAEFARRVASMAAQLRLCGLRPAERVLVVMGAGLRSLAGLLAALHAGLEPALVPCGQGAVDLASCARAAEVAAIIGPTAFGPLALGEAYLSAAALADTVRLIATLGPDAVDGAADLWREASGDGSVGDAGPAPAIVTFAGSGPSPSCLVHRQAALFASARALAAAAQLSPGGGIFSTILPATLAGLVAGPVLALSLGANLRLHGPFEAGAFLAARDADPGASLVIPQGLAAALDDLTPLAGDEAVVLLSRFPDRAAFAVPPPIVFAGRFIDLYAFGESEVWAEPRERGVARRPDGASRSGR